MIYTRMKILVILLFCMALFSGCAGPGTKKSSPFAEKGILDLRNWNFEKDGIVALNGQWEFFWQSLLNPQPLHSESPPKPTGYYDFPGVWNNQKVSGGRYPSEGYASFALTIFHDGSQGQLSLEIKDMASAYTLYADGRKISSNGVVGKTRDSMIPEFKPATVQFPLSENPVKLVLHISNFHHRKGGPWSVINLGSIDQIQEKQTRSFFLNTFLIGSIFIMGLYHLGLFIISQKFKPALYFGLFCCVITLRSLVVNERYLHTLLPKISWGLLLKLEYVTFYLAVPLFGMFMFLLFPREFPKKSLQAVQVFALVFSSSVILLPARFFTHTLLSYQAFTLLSCTYLIFILYKAHKKRRDGITALSIGFMFLFLSVIYDILQANEILETGFFLPIGIFIFIFSQASVLSFRFSRALDRVEMQKHLLVKTNTAFRKEVSERKKMEGRLQQAQKMEAIGTLAGGVAHDLNNVLSAQVAYPDLLLMDLPENSPLRDPIIQIRESGEKAAAIVQDLLTMARRGLIIKDVTNLNTIVKTYLDSPECKRLKKFHPNVGFTTQLDPGLLNILGSPVHLFKTIMNLINNAAEAMPDGGNILISTENQCPSNVGDKKEETSAVLKISDTGTGIESHDIKRIYEPFYTKKVMGKSGTGLGMAVVWGTVKDHGGEIDVHSIPHKGTVFTLCFPTTQRELCDPKIALPPEAYQGNQESVLVVDDVAGQRHIVSEILGKLGYCVTAVESGEKAVEYMKTGSADLLILDMIMDPGIDGCETYRQILTYHPGQKALITSGFSETSRVKAARKLGAGDYIKKPYTFETLGFAVKKALEK